MQSYYIYASPKKTETVTKVTKIKIGRDADSGQFIPVREAEKRPKTTVVETIKVKR